MGHELLGVELIRKPLGALSAAQADLGKCPDSPAIEPHLLCLQPVIASRPSGR
jgi:hypothetical protein